MDLIVGRWLLVVRPHVALWLTATGEARVVIGRC